MSSESFDSSSSRLSQFGLYRTIDARTEEFLRLSRKRQIRQGCACAAASTAITVTVVIVVFFVYEFSLNSATNFENAWIPQWLTFMNDSLEDSSLDFKLTGAIPDKTTLQILPMLLKAVKSNSFLEKFIEDQSSSSPSHTTQENSEENIHKVLNLPPNWFKFPTTKLYAIEYKTYPVAYFKHPTDNIEQYTKTYKKRNDQRIIKYLDKMISNKVYIRSKPMFDDEMYNNIQPNKTIIVKKAAHHSKNRVPTKNKMHEKIVVDCNCDKNVGEILQKILLKLSKLLPKNETKLDHFYTKSLINCDKSESLPLLYRKSSKNDVIEYFTVKQIFETNSPKTTSIFSYESDLVDEPHTISSFNHDYELPLVKTYVPTTLKSFYRPNTKSSVQKSKEFQENNEKSKKIMKYKKNIKKTKSKVPKKLGIETYLDNILDNNFYTSAPIFKNVPSDARQGLKLSYFNGIEHNMHKNKIVATPTTIYNYITKNIDSTINYNTKTTNKFNNIITLLKSDVVNENTNSNNNLKQKDLESMESINLVYPKSDSPPIETIWNTSGIDISTMPKKYFEPNDASTTATYFDQNKTVYRFMKNDLLTLLSEKFKNSIPKSVVYAKPNKKLNPLTPKPVHDNRANLKNRTLYIVKDFKQIMKKEKYNFGYNAHTQTPIIIVEPKLLKQNKKVNIQSQSTQTENETLPYNVSTEATTENVGDEADFISDIPDVILSEPESTIDKPEQKYFKKQEFDFSWEDRHNANTDNAEPVSMIDIPHPKPIYWEFQRNENKHETEDEYFNNNMFTNFYDVKL